MQNLGKFRCYQNAVTCNLLLLLSQNNLSSFTSHDENLLAFTCKCAHSVMQFICHKFSQKIKNSTSPAK